MAIYATEAIVIGRTNFGEADRVIRLLTPEYGKISAVAKGVRKIRSRMAGHLELLSQVTLMLAEGKSLDVVTSARLGWYPHSLTQDYRRLSQAFMFTTMMDRLLEDRQSQPELFKLLAEALRQLDDGAPGPLLELWFKLQLLARLGYQPELSGCQVCGTSDAGLSYYFSAERGGIVDTACREAGDQAMPHATVKLWRLLTTQPYVRVAGVGEAEAIASTSLPQCDEFYNYHLGRAFVAGGQEAYGQV
jgi:DNA repair protein RecO (recombination protein O)